MLYFLKNVVVKVIWGIKGEKFMFYFIFLKNVVGEPVRFFGACKENVASE